MAGHLSRSSFVTRFPCFFFFPPPSLRFHSYADILSATSTDNGRDILDPVTQEGFLTYYGTFVLARPAVDDWNDDNGPGFDAYEECEGNQMLSWKGKGYGTVLKLLMVSVAQGGEGQWKFQARSIN